MDNFGYKNWGGEDSYDSSPNKYGNYGNTSKKSGGKYTTESFDYDISSDFADSPPIDQRAKKGGKAPAESFGSSRFSTARSRSSVEERTREILERNKNVGKATEDAGDGGRMKSYEETYKELMGGLELKEELSKPKPQKKAEETPVSKSNLSMSRSGMDSSLDSPGDSLEISAADLEVGALAARRAQERANDRRRRMSLDKAPHTLDQSSFNTLKENSMYAKRGSASPDLGNKRRSASDLAAYAGGMQFSSALSSIQKSTNAGEGDRLGGDFARFGSTERSDDDIYRMLNVTAGTNESLKFGSAAASARNSSQAPLQGGRGGSGVGMGKQSGAGAKKSTARGGGGSDGEGDLSDVTQGSKDDEEDSPPPRGGKVPAILTGKQSAPAAGKALGGANPTNAESFYSTVAEEEDDGDGSRSGSGDSDQAHSPFSKSAGSYTFPAAEGKTGTGSKAARPEEEDEYSLDDFETDANQSPEKSAPGKAATSAHGAKQTEPAAKAVAPSHTVQPPPSHLGSPSPAQKTLTPTSSTSSMHAGPAKSTNLNSVEEIMQRWYTADSDFMHRSLQRISSGETGFTLDEEDMKPTVGGVKPKEGIAMPSHDSFATVSSAPGTAAAAPSTANATPAVPSAVPSSQGPSPAMRAAATPSPLTTAGPTPVPAALAGIASAAGDNASRPGSATSGVSDGTRPRSSSDYSSDSAHGGSSASAAAAPASQPMVQVPLFSTKTEITQVPLSGTGFNAPNPSAVGEHEKTVFDLSDSFPDNQPWAEGGEKKPTVLTSAPGPSVPARAPEPEQKPAEIPKLFASRSRGGSYMSLDQLPTFDAEPTPAPIQPTAYQRPASASEPRSVSPSTSAASRSRYQDSRDRSDDDRSVTSHDDSDERDALRYVTGETEKRPPRDGGKQKQSWIVPPKYRSRPGDTNERPRSAPPKVSRAEDLPPRKLSANTAAKIQQIKSLSPEERRHMRVTRPRHGVSASAAAPTALSTIRARSRDAELLATQQKSVEAVQRLTQENWRLFRKYERLEHEIQELRFSHQQDEVPHEVVPEPAPTAGKRPNAHKRSPTGIVERIDRSDKGSKITKSDKGPVSTSQGRESRQRDKSVEIAPEPAPAQAPTHTRAFPAVPTGVPAAGKASAHSAPDGWEVQMEDALAHLRGENRKLLEREKAVRVREEAVSIREATVEMREKLVTATATASIKTEEERKKEFFLNEELTILREREHDLLREVDKLKAALFVKRQDSAAIEDQKLRQSLGLDADLNLGGDYEPLAKTFASQMHKAGIYGPSVLKPQLKAYYAEKGKTKSEPKDGTEEMVSVSKADYEKLVSDHAAQERLLDAFQKENDRLAKFAREKDTEQQLRSAVYFDEREELNREVNRLKNVSRAGGAAANDSVTEEGAPRPFDEIPIPTSKKTADMLRMELNADATIRALKERLKEAESGMGERERDLQVTIEKLRRDNRELAAMAANVNLQNIAPQNSDYLQLQTENRVLADQVGQLKQKLEWYAQNQRLLDEGEVESQQLRHALSALKRELVQRGLDAKAVDRLISAHRQASSPGGNAGQLEESGVTHAQDGMDRSMLSGVDGKGRQGHGGRSFADIKKIKELEGVVRDLQESLTKRYPDSVASLIRAATVSDSVQAQRRQQDQQVELLRKELEDMKALHETRLRSLRQEHERIKVQYEKVLGDLEKAQENGAGPASPGVGIGGFTKGSASSANTVKTLSQALHKIRELEEELERTRVFYTKKVEEGHRKYEAQIRALKRGTAGEEVAVPQSAAVAPQPQQQQLQEQMQQATAVYAERIALLERELMSTAEELGRVKASAQSAPQSKPTHAPTEHDLYRQQHLVKVTELERQEMLSTHQQRLEEVKAYHSEFVAQLQSQWGTERASLQQRLRDEEARCAELRGELMSAVRGAASAPMGAASAVSYRSASDGKHFAQVESQIEALEVRMQRREKELMSAVEEAKAAAAVERSRLEALHAQECREKDEQLVRFQHELVQLVNALRHWKQQSQVSIATEADGASVPLYV